MSFWLYSYLYTFPLYTSIGSSPPQPAIQSLTASSLSLYPSFTLNCSSSGSAASEVSWSIDDRPLDTSGQPLYTTFQLLRDGTTSTYDNLLVISISNVDEYSGQYGCSVRNGFGSVAQEANFSGKCLAILASRALFNCRAMIAPLITQFLNIRIPSLSNTDTASGLS